MTKKAAPASAPKAKKPRKIKEEAIKTAPAVPLSQMLTQALMTLIPERGFAGLTLEDVADTAGLSMAEVRTAASSITDILALYGQEIDAQMLAAGPVEGEMRDRLFDLIMRRFDALAEYKEAAQLIVNEATMSPTLALKLLPIAKRGVVSTLSAADITPTPLRVAGLGMVMLAALRSYLTDDSEDLGKTMSTLDSALAKLQSAAQALGPLAKVA